MFDIMKKNKIETDSFYAYSPEGDMFLIEVIKKEDESITIEIAESKRISLDYESAIELAEMILYDLGE